MRSVVVSEFGAPLEDMTSIQPMPKGAEVLIKVHHCGVCHSDVHIHDGYFDLGGGNKLPLNSIKLPHVMGHEVQGEVVALGPDVTSAKLGELRAVFPWIGCNACPACARGEENHCNRPQNLGCSSECPGGYADYMLVPHEKYLLDYGTVDPALGAAYMCSGLTAYSALKKVGLPGPEDEIVVLGCGGVGMMGVQFAQALFGKQPIAADIDEARLAAAQKAGAKAVLNSKGDGVAKQFVKQTGGAYAVVDFVGSEASFNFANAIVRKGGKIILVGLFGGALNMPLPLIPMRAISIMGSFVGSLPEAEEMMALVRAGKVAPIPVEKRPLSEANQALSDLRQGKITGRVVLTP